MSGEVSPQVHDSMDSDPDATSTSELENDVLKEVSSSNDSESKISSEGSSVNSQANSPEIGSEDSGSNDFVDNKVADNDARLLQLETEHETLKSQYMRIAADFDNFRKRQSRDQDDLKVQLICSTLSEILPVVDNFERARQQLDPQGEEAQALHRSYQGLYKQLVDVLKQLGVAPMRVAGQTFDPTLHEAVLREPSDEYVEDLITEELQRGYHLNGRVLRHALVKVSMGPGPQNVNKDQEPKSENPPEEKKDNSDASNSEA